ncbi:Hypothetical predicted protein [Podarcis lilfordi]|uniref:Uncharacterized protein n=1 Tax=Podarcis lilfordi TaxID=74358 RepID=A0AA35NWZ0_9SAUR|nr:Hypothetical predicted protein [Podarcis lilfordi]
MPRVGDLDMMLLPSSESSECGSVWHNRNTCAPSTQRANGDARGGAYPLPAGEGPPRSAPPFWPLRNKRVEAAADGELFGRLSSGNKHILEKRSLCELPSQLPHWCV